MYVKFVNLPLFSCWNRSYILDRYSSALKVLVMKKMFRPRLICGTGKSVITEQCSCVTFDLLRESVGRSVWDHCGTFRGAQTKRGTDHHCQSGTKRHMFLTPFSLLFSRPLVQYIRMDSNTNPTWFFYHQQWPSRSAYLCSSVSIKMHKRQSDAFSDHRLLHGLSCLTANDQQVDELTVTSCATVAEVPASTHSAPHSSDPHVRPT